MSIAAVDYLMLQLPSIRSRFPAEKRKMACTCQVRWATKTVAKDTYLLPPRTCAFLHMWNLSRRFFATSNTWTSRQMVRRKKKLSLGQDNASRCFCCSDLNLNILSDDLLDPIMHSVRQSLPIRITFSGKKGNCGKCETGDNLKIATYGDCYRKVCLYGRNYGMWMRYEGIVQLLSTFNERCVNRCSCM